MKRWVSFALLIAGCAVSPPGNRALDQARASVAAAQADSTVLRYAAAELEAASRTLEDAERARSTDEGAHLAYLAEQRSRIAREIAHARANERESLEARLKDAEEERDRAQARAKEIEQERGLNDRLAAEVRRLQAQVAELQARETQRGWILTLGADLLFDLGQAKLKPGGRRAIANLARFMRQYHERADCEEDDHRENRQARAAGEVAHRADEERPDDRRELAQHVVEAEELAGPLLWHEAREVRAREELHAALDEAHHCRDEVELEG